MKVFISYSHLDKKYANIIVETLEKAGHDVWIDTKKLSPGDNWLEEINKALRDVEAYIVIISENSLNSPNVLNELSAITLGELSSNKKRIIPIVVDRSIIPSYLNKYQFIDFNQGVENGLAILVRALRTKTKQETKKKTVTNEEDIQEKSISILSDALHAGRLTLVCGAGVSVGAGIPEWDELLLRLLNIMMQKISAIKSMPTKGLNPKEFQKRYKPSALIVGKYLKLNLGKDFLLELRNALYFNNPKTSDVIDAIVELTRPQRDGNPLDSIITFNFDGLMEENLLKNNIKYKSIYSEGIRNKPNEIPIFHVHGFLPRNGKIPKDVEIVFSEDAYHTQFTDSFSWSNLIQLNKLSQNTCLFIGISLADPNLRRLLDVANRKDPSKSLNHYIIMKSPKSSQKTDGIDELAVFLTEQDANGLGLNVLWVKDFSEIAPLLLKVIK